MPRELRRGDVIFVDCGEVIGSEQGGIRPAVVIQNNVGNRHAPTTIVAFVTSRIKKNMPTHVWIHSQFKVPSCVLLEQIRTISLERVRNYQFSLNKSDMLRIDAALKESLALVTQEETHYER